MIVALDSSIVKSFLYIFAFSPNQANELWIMSIEISTRLQEADKIKVGA